MVHKGCPAQGKERGPSSWERGLFAAGGAPLLPALSNSRLPGCGRLSSYRQRREGNVYNPLSP